MTSSDVYPVLHPQAISRTVEGEAVIVLPESGQVAVLNEVGTQVWELADGQHSVEEIVASVVEAYDVSPDQAREDVDAFVQELIEKRMLTLSEEETKD
jgi:hypothetical protein